MTASPATQLILIGGTLCSSRNDSGLLEPSVRDLIGPLESAGFTDTESIIRLFNIDSINFDIDTHYIPLREAALNVLKAGKVPVICGGTDTLAWYSTLLTKDLMRHGWLQPDSGEKVIFLSSMISLEDSPEHVRKILEGGKLLSTQHLTGGFAVCAEHMSGDVLAVHDVLNHFDKVSSSLTNAFRSRAPIGYIIGDTFTRNEGYQSPPVTISASRGHDFAHIAPPLLRGHDGKAILAYLDALSKHQPPFDGILIEGMQGVTDANVRMHARDYQRLITMIRWFKESGSRVVFCNPMRFDDRSLSINPAIQASMWDTPVKGQAKGLADIGAEFKTALPKDAYLDMMLTEPGVRSTVSLPASTREPTRQKQLGIRYVPHIPIMENAINALAPAAKTLKYSALPHRALPDTVTTVIDANEHKWGTGRKIVFEYDHTQLVAENGALVREGNQRNPYKAGQLLERSKTNSTGPAI